ncbi:hypothetical protein BU202_02000 [Streptococcus cuniculi]|uniref:Uncharacterized protein n=1 Tax=Streptococcus cuniculi TaxID=1432788 RepID=A0A1Q8E9E2_9STRE|nr:hypothetical protein [Streptococcus cuniculi]OLF48414.1 hypothetical protein BU202_02000 [Streptococcus cuniculi]
MSDYLPIRESLGYRNVKTALWNVFSVNLDAISIDEKLFESFSFIFQYKSYEMTMTISDTEKHVQFQAGEGGIFDIWFPNPKDELFGATFLHELMEDEKIKERTRRVFGRDEKAIEYAMQALKD